MKERPILFSAPMVRAILDGSKTQTRRVVKHEIRGPNYLGHFNWYDKNGWQGAHGGDTPFGKTSAALLCPYGQPGDRLWVRETWNHENYPYGPADPDCCFFYRVDYFDDPLGPDLELSEDGIRRKWIPSIHMPRYASRIDLEITGVRVERLQDISEADALAEGIERPEDISDATLEAIDVWTEGSERDAFNVLNQPVRQYRRLWESINGPGSWDVNPWVWVVEFRRISD
jgi:hypothetical protein